MLTCGRFFFFYGGDVGFERYVVERLGERLEVGCEEKVSFKYILVSIRQAGERVMMSQRHYSRGIKELERWDFKGDRRLSSGLLLLANFLFLCF